MYLLKIRRRENAKTGRLELAPLIAIRYFTCVVLAGCSVSPPDVRRLENGTYWLTFPRDAIGGQYWKDPVGTIPPYMRKNHLIPTECQHGVIIIDKSSTHAQFSVIFKCAP